MRAVVQRVASAAVSVRGETAGRIARGFLVLLGVGKEDGPEDVRYIAGKLAGLRIFEDGDGKMNLDLAAVGGGILLVSQFTLYGDARHGFRPSFSAAAGPERARELYEAVAAQLRERGLPVETGIFREDMQVSLINDGPVTILIDSRKGF